MSKAIPPGEFIKDQESHNSTCYHYHGDCAAARIQKALEFIEMIWKQAPPEVYAIKQLLEGYKGHK